MYVIVKAEMKASCLTDWGHIGILSLGTATYILCVPTILSNQQVSHNTYRSMTIFPKYFYTYMQTVLPLLGLSYNHICDFTYVIPKEIIMKKPHGYKQKYIMFRDFVIIGHKLFLMHFPADFKSNTQSSKKFKPC